MNIYERLAKYFNDRLAELSAGQKAEVRSLRYKGEDYPYVVFENVENQMGIAISYNDGEWTVEFLGTHVHVPDMEEADEYLFMNYVLPILADVLVVAIMPDGGQVCVDILRIENEEFSAAELKDAADITVLSWSGSLGEEAAARCAAYARRVYH